MEKGLTRLETSFAGAFVQDSLKVCRTCHIAKLLEQDFYRCRTRNECKSCTIQKNMAYYKQAKVLKKSSQDGEQKRSYMVEYYANNKEKFVEYRRRFKEKHPEYHKEYGRKRKNEKRQKKMLGDHS